jgi:hypothetical protein
MEPVSPELRQSYRKRRKHNTVTAPVTEEKKDNVVSLRSVGLKKLTEAPGKAPVSPDDLSAPTADSVQTMPDALKALRNRHHVPEPPVASPLSMLHRARQRPASSEAISRQRKAVVNP